MQLFARTEVGCVRNRNEDSFAVANLKSGERGLGPGTRVQSISAHGTAVVVCDGMGGAAAGHIASALAADALIDSLHSSVPFRDARSAQVALLQAIGKAHRSVGIFSLEHEGCKGMGSTLTAALILPGEAHIGHVGDSRAYLLRGTSLRQLTHDDSLAEHLRSQGQLSQEDLQGYRFRNVLLQAIGVQDELSVEIATTPLFAGDTLLLCSDGLTGVLSESAITELSIKHKDPVSCCRALTEAACAKGAPDNVTVAMVRLVGDDLPSARSDQPIDVVSAEYTLG